MIHPATGYSLTRSMTEATQMAEKMSQLLSNKERTVGDVATALWDHVWNGDRRKVASFQVFGMELLAGLDVNLMNKFFQTFFRLPKQQWTGFLASKLSPLEVLLFAFTTFLIAPWDIKVRLITHTIQSPTTMYMKDAFFPPEAEAESTAIVPTSSSSSSSSSPSS